MVVSAISRFDYPIRVYRGHKYLVILTQKPGIFELVAGGAPTFWASATLWRHQANSPGLPGLVSTTTDLPFARALRIRSQHSESVYLLS
jgi:hypothetical protein